MEYNDINLIELYNQNKSLSEIAEAFQVTRNSVSGKVTRLRNKGLIAKREIGKHPAGLIKGGSGNLKKNKAKLKPKHHTIMIKPKNYRDMSKNELRDMLRAAVENTK